MKRTSRQSTFFTRTRLDRYLATSFRALLALQALAVITSFGVLFQLGTSQQPRSTPTSAFPFTMSGSARGSPLSGMRRGSSAHSEELDTSRDNGIMNSEAPASTSLRERLFSRRLKTAARLPLRRLRNVTASWKSCAFPQHRRQPGICGAHACRQLPAFCAKQKDTCILV